MKNSKGNNIKLFEEYIREDSETVMVKVMGSDISKVVKKVIDELQTEIGDKELDSGKVRKYVCENSPEGQVMDQDELVREHLYDIAFRECKKIAPKGNWRELVIDKYGFDETTCELITNLVVDKVIKRLDTK